MTSQTSASPIKTKMLLMSPKGPESLPTRSCHYLNSELCNYTRTYIRRFTSDWWASWSTRKVFLWTTVYLTVENNLILHFSTHFSDVSTYSCIIPQKYSQNQLMGINLLMKRSYGNLHIYFWHVYNIINAKWALSLEASLACLINLHTL